MKKIVALLLTGILSFSMAACDTENSSTGDGGTSHSSPNDPGGIGMRYDGKLGYDLGGGLVMGSDGKVGLGFGF